MNATQGKISRDAFGRLIQHTTFEFKGRMYAAVRFNLGRCEVYLTGTSGLEHWVGYAHEVSYPLGNAAYGAIRHTDRMVEKGAR